MFNRSGAEMIWKEHAQVVDLVGFGEGMVSPVPSAECTGVLFYIADDEHSVDLCSYLMPSSHDLSN